jgi:hypothetical protein
MALERPEGISNDSWTQLQALARTDEPGAIAIANRVATAVQTGRNADTFVSESISARYNSKFGSSRPLASGVFANVLQPEARVLVNTGSSIDMSDGDARASFVRSIEAYVSPRV